MLMETRHLIIMHDVFLKGGGMDLLWSLHGSRSARRWQCPACSQAYGLIGSRDSIR